MSGPTPESALAGLLGEHRVWSSFPASGLTVAWRCTCGHQERGDKIGFPKHRAHVAAALHAAGVRTADEQVTLWHCPDCAFGFDAEHVNTDGTGYTCPLCAEHAAEERVRVLTEQVGKIEALATDWEHIAKNHADPAARVRFGKRADSLRAALNEGGSDER